MPKLNFELVPDGCWYSNLRTILSKKQWDFLKAYAKEQSGGKCAICGKKTDRLDAHEVWSYDRENAVQKLEDIINKFIEKRIQPEYQRSVSTILPKYAKQELLGIGKGKEFSDEMPRCSAWRAIMTANVLG